jgi:riboflavin kinase / FMN adenylyltransferase
MVEFIRKDRDFKRPFKNPVLTLGNFDGVHLGHQRIFQLVSQKAREIGGEAIVYTFDPHPVEVLAPERKPPLITPLKEKLKLIEEMGIDVVIVAAFSKEYARQTPEEFVQGTLYDQIQIRQLFVGHDFTFGKGREGDIALLKDLGRKYGFNVEVVGAVRVAGRVVSSSLIRELIQKGEMPEATRLLGRNYHLVGKVIHGHGRGSRKLGFPTANLKVEGTLIPKPGIYALWAVLEGKKYAAVANLGWNPTFHDQKFSIEVHILNFDQDIYGETIGVEFVERLRDEVPFSGPEELIAQIKRDIAEARKVLKRG